MISDKPSRFDARFIKLGYKLSKLLSLLPTQQKSVLSNYEDKNFRQRFYQDLWRKAAENLGYDYQALGYGFWEITSPQGNRLRGKQASVGLDTQVGLLLSGNKPLSHRLACGLPNYRAPAYQEFTLDTLSEALTFIENQGNSSCVVKPARDTGAGYGVFTGINSYQTLVKAAIKASVHCKQLLIEETIVGHSYRLLFLDGELIHAIRRDPPQVIGNGRDDIRRLIELENKRRLDSDEIISLFPITLDMTCVKTLEDQGLSLKQVPEEQSVVVVKKVVNQNAAEQNTEITDRIDQSILDTCVELSKRIGIRLSGVDILSQDLSLPLQESGGVVNEINGNPGLHHHYLTSSTAKPTIAETILERSLNTL